MTIAPQTPAVAEDLDVRLPSGRVRVRRFGAHGSRLVIGVPGLSANLAGLDFLAERIVRDDRQIVTLDLRGRGRSEITPPGTYGWRNHARDLFALADELGAPSFTVFGQSMGAAIAITCAGIDASRLERLVLLDACGVPDESSAVPIGASVARLGTVYPSADAAIGLIKQLGVIPEWSEYWDRYFRYELRDVEGGVTASSDRTAVAEDMGYGAAMLQPRGDAPVYALWKSLTMPVLLLRAAREILPGFGHIVPAADAERFAKEVSGSRVADIDANHYTINTHEASADAINHFLEQ